MSQPLQIAKQYDYFAASAAIARNLTAVEKEQAVVMECAPPNIGMIIASFIPPDGDIRVDLDLLRTFWVKRPKEWIPRHRSLSEGRILVVQYDLLRKCLDKYAALYS